MYLYAITDGTRVKIGFSQDVRKRMSSLQGGNAGVKLSLIFKVNCGTRAMANKLEQIFHKRYASVRHTGEWFNISAAVVLNDLEFTKTVFPIMLDVFDQEKIQQKVMGKMSRAEIEQYVESRWPTPKIIAVQDCSDEERPRFTSEFVRRAQRLSWVWDRNAHMSEEDHITLRQMKENSLEFSAILPKLSTPERWRLHKRFEEEDNGSWPRPMVKIGGPFVITNEEMTHVD